MFANHIKEMISKIFRILKAKDGRLGILGQVKIPVFLKTPSLNGQLVIVNAKNIYLKVSNRLQSALLNQN